MQIRDNTTSPLDLELARRFRQQRHEIAMNLPELPDREALAARSPIVERRRPYPAVLKIALAMVVTVTSILWLTSPSEPDPGALYADIIAANTLTTDRLLWVTLGTLPEKSSTLGIDEFDTPFDVILPIN
jgi:hypothetical protein